MLSPDTIRNPHITFESPKLKLSLSILRGLVLGPLWIPKFEDAQVSCIKWRRYIWPSASTDFQLQITNSTGIY